MATTLVVGGSFAGIKLAWDLRHRLDGGHRILLLSDKPRTVFRASFPRVLFQNLDLEAITMDLAANFRAEGLGGPTMTISAPRPLVIRRRLAGSGGIAASAP